MALLTDGRFSGGSHGFIIGHITPEAQAGGPIALLRDGDRIVVDARTCELRVELSDGELAARRALWKEPPPEGDERRAEQVRAAREIGIRRMRHGLTRSEKIMRNLKAIVIVWSDAGCRGIGG